MPRTPESRIWAKVILLGRSDMPNDCCGMKATRSGGLLLVLTQHLAGLAAGGLALHVRLLVYHEGRSSAPRGPERMLNGRFFCMIKSSFFSARLCRLGVLS